MIAVRFHGRGGQGAVTSSELMALAAISEGRYAQAFPSFGPERRGAPLQAYLRIADEPIYRREEVYSPDIVVVIDPALLTSPVITKGLNPHGTLVVNTTRSFDEIKQDCGFQGRIAKVDANTIAEQELGVTITNTTMLGALLKASPLVKLESLSEPINNRFGSIAEKNIKAFTRAFNETLIEE